VIAEYIEEEVDPTGLEVGCEIPKHFSSSRMEFDSQFRFSPGEKC
jgi:hypothetical protein